AGGTRRKRLALRTVLRDLDPGPTIVRFGIADDALARSAGNRSGRLAASVPHPVELVALFHYRRLVGTGHVEAACRSEVEDGPAEQFPRHLGPVSRVAGDGQRDPPG